MHLSLVLKGIPPLHYCTVIQHQSSLIGCRFKKPGPNCCNRRDACCVEDTQSANTVCFSHLTRASHFRDNNPLPTYLPLKGELSCSLVFWWHIKDPLCPSLSLSLSLPFSLHRSEDKSARRRISLQSPPSSSFTLSHPV